ncbi:Oxoglutarate iron-dependent oxygenase protein [Colletotrichum asianum]
MLATGRLQRGQFRYSVSRVAGGYRAQQLRPHHGHASTTCRVQLDDLSQSGSQLEEYDCINCGAEKNLRITSTADHARIGRAFTGLFSALSAWEPSDNLVLDISIHSPSDSDHWYKYLTFVPDMTPENCNWKKRLPKPIQVNFNDEKHGWIASHRVSPPRPVLIEDMCDTASTESPAVDGNSRENLIPSSWTSGNSLRALEKKLENWSGRGRCNSFMVDASHFFSSCEPSWKWSNLTLLALTSRLLAPDATTT